MVNGSQTVSSVGGGAPLFVRASSAAANLSAESTGVVEAAANLPADQVVADTLQAYRYNSFEFAYRQDFGKIVLLRQKPDTGELVQQFPSEYYLRKYADSERVARSAEGTQVSKAAKVSAANKTADAPVASQAVSSGVTAPAPVVVAAPAVVSAPTLPSAAATSGAGSGTGVSARVDLTI